LDSQKDTPPLVLATTWVLNDIREFPRVQVEGWSILSQEQVGASILCSLAGPAVPIGYSDRFRPRRGGMFAVASRRTSRFCGRPLNVNLDSVDIQTVKPEELEGIPFDRLAEFEAAAVPPIPS
jgi:hypothetical protein